MGGLAPRAHPRVEPRPQDGQRRAAGGAARLGQIVLLACTPQAVPAREGAIAGAEITGSGAPGAEPAADDQAGRQGGGTDGERGDRTLAGAEHRPVPLQLGQEAGHAIEPCGRIARQAAQERGRNGVRNACARRGPGDAALEQLPEPQRDRLAACRWLSMEAMEQRGAERELIGGSCRRGAETSSGAA